MYFEGYSPEWQVLSKLSVQPWMSQGLKKIEFQPGLGQEAFKFTCPVQVLVCSFNELDSLFIRQVGRKSYLPGKKISCVVPGDWMALFWPRVSNIDQHLISHSNINMFSSSEVMEIKKSINQE